MIILKNYVYMECQKEAWKRFDIKKNYHNYDLEFSGLKNNMTNVQASMGIIPA